MNAKERVEAEVSELCVKQSRLDSFIGSEAFWALSVDARQLLLAQTQTMAVYAGILRSRLRIWGRE